MQARTGLEGLGRLWWLAEGPCSWRSRKAGPGWRAAVASGVWNPGSPEGGALEAEEEAGLSGMEEEEEACLCDWLRPDRVERGIKTR